MVGCRLAEALRRHVHGKQFTCTHSYHSLRLHVIKLNRCKSTEICNRKRALSPDYTRKTRPSEDEAEHILCKLITEHCAI